MRFDSNRRWLGMLLPILLTVFVSLLASPLLAQESTGTIEGVVSDPTGAVVPSAAVTITSKRTGRTLTVNTTGAGVYVMRALQPGEYEVRVEKTGFKTASREVVVRVGSASPGDVTLEVGSPTEVVTVMAEAATQVNPVENKIYDVITQQQIENSPPASSRNFLDLAGISPGVQLVDGGSFDPTKNQMVGVSVGGRTGRVTRIQVDGIDISDETVGTTVQNISQDSVQEFQLSQSSLDPSTSLTSSGAVNIVTRSGGNEFHGAGFFFYRDEEVAAVPTTFTGNPVVDAQLKGAEFDRQQGGFSVGGPFIKDRVFWFANFEKINQDATTFTRPTNFPNFARAVTTPFNENMALGRIDWNINNNLRAFVRYSHNGNDAATGFGGSNVCCAPFVNDNNTNVLAVGADLTSGKFSHSFRYGYTNFDNQIVPADLGLPVFEATNGIPISIALNTRREFFSNPNRLAPQATFQDNHQFKYDGGFLRGAHSFRYGGEVNYIQVNLFASFFGVGPEVRGTFSAANRNAIIARGGDPLNPLEYPVSFVIIGNGQGSFTEIANHGRPAGGLNNTRLSWYIADSWRFRPTFTINAALKYELDTGQVNDDLPGPAILEQIVGPGQSRPTRLDKNNFAPQLGFAWDIGGRSKTILRGGAGVFYETQIFNNGIFDRTDKLASGFGFAFATPPLSGIDSQGRVLGPTGQPVSNIDTRLLQGQPIAAVINQIGQLQAAYQAAFAGFTPNPSGPTAIEASGRTSAGPIFNQEFSSPTAYQFNIGIQRQLGTDFVLSVDYLRNRATHTNVVRDYNRLRAADNLNVAAAMALKAAGQHTSLGNAFTGNNPNFTDIQVIVPGGYSVYNALQVRLNKRLTNFGRLVRNLSLDVNYALSKFEGLATDQDFHAATQFNDNFLSSANYGPTALDRTHQFTFSSQFDLPWGINLSQITSMRSALPLTPFLTTSQGGATEILFSDLDGDGTFNDFLPGGGRGSFGRSVGSVSELNNLITSFNSQFAGTLTPAGRALVNAGVYTQAELVARGLTIKPIALAPADQVMNDAFFNTNLRISKAFGVSERVRIRPLVEIFNLFNVSNFNVLSGELAGAAGQINGTPPGRRSDKLGLGSGSFASGQARAVQFGIRVNF